MRILALSPLLLLLLAYSAACSFTSLDGLVGAASDASVDASGLDAGAAEAGAADASAPIADARTDAPGATYTSVVLQDGPVAYWPLDEIALPTADDRAGAHNGTYFGPVKLGQPGPHGPGSRSIELDGLSARTEANSVARLPASTWTAGISVEAWVYAIGTGARQEVLAFNLANGDDGLSLRLDSDNVWKMTGNAGFIAPAARAAPLQRWMHVVLTVASDDTSAFYVDGAVEISFRTAWRPTSDGLFTMGAEYATGLPLALRAFFAGRLAHVAVYPRVLPLARVVAHRAYAR